MKRNLSFRGFLIIVFSLCLNNSFCQDISRTHNFWLSLGPGFFVSDPVSTYALSMSTGWELIMQHVKADAAKVRKHTFKMRIITGQGSATEDYFLKVTEVGLLYGKSLGKTVKFTAACGLSAVKGYKSIEYMGTNMQTGDSGPFFKPGFPVELELDFAGKHAGLGICGFADLNPECTFTGAGLVIIFGKLR